MRRPAATTLFPDANVALDCTEPPIQRPSLEPRQTQAYSGKQKTHTLLYERTIINFEERKKFRLGSLLFAYRLGSLLFAIFSFILSFFSPIAFSRSLFFVLI